MTNTITVFVDSKIAFRITPDEAEKFDLKPRANISLDVAHKIITRRREAKMLPTTERSRF